MRMWSVLVVMACRLCLADDDLQCQRLALEKAAMEKANATDENGTFIKLGWHEGLKLRLEKTAKITCSHLGYREGDPKKSPEVELHWFHDGKRVVPNERIQISGCKKKPFINGVDLTIFRIVRADEGTYSCKLWMKGKSNSSAPAIEVNIELEILYSKGDKTRQTTAYNISQQRKEAELRWMTMFLPVPIVGVIIILICCCAFKYDQAKKGSLTCMRYVYKKVLMRKETRSHSDMIVRYRANYHETANLVEGMESVKEGDLENICKKYTSLFPFVTPSDVKDISAFEIQRGRLQCNLQHSMPIVLGTGNFGQVYAGTVLNPKGSITPVAVKKLNDGYSTDELGNFLREVVTIMRAGNHINVISLVATIVLDTLDEATIDGGVKVQRPPILVMELATGGNLRKYLQDNRENFVYSPVLQSDWCLKDDSNPNRLDIQSLVSFGYQVARGMEHLSSRNILHRDLAARNVLLSDQLVVKIADFGLSKFMTDEKQYYRVTHEGITPAKWTAPESLWTSKFTVKSDVWSYGVLLWEILTLGNQPYPTIPACKLYEYLTTGSRLKRPNIATFELHEIMLICWSWDPDLRPDFSTLVQKMSDVMISQRKQPYGSFSNSRMRLTGCSNERDSGMSCGNSSVTESCFDSRSETAYSTTSYGSYTSTDTVIHSLEERGPRERTSTIAYEIMNPLYEGHSSEGGDEESAVYVNDMGQQVVNV